SLTHGQADRETSLVEFLGTVEVEVPCPGIDLTLVVFRYVGWEHVAQIKAGILLIQIETRLTRLHLAANGSGQTAPRALDLGEIFGDRTDRAVLFDELGDHFIQWLEHVGVDADVPVAMRHDVVTGPGL